MLTDFDRQRLITVLGELVGCESDAAACNLALVRKRFAQWNSSITSSLVKADPRLISIPLSSEKPVIAMGSKQT